MDKVGKKMAANLESDMIIEIMMVAVRLHSSLTKSKIFGDLSRYFGDLVKWEKEHNDTQFDEKEADFIALVKSLGIAMRKRTLDGLDEGVFTPKSVDEVMIWCMEKEIEQIEEIEDRADRSGSITFEQFLDMMKTVETEMEMESGYVNDHLDAILYPSRQVD